MGNVVLCGARALGEIDARSGTIRTEAILQNGGRCALACSVVQNGGVIAHEGKLRECRFGWK